jgi:hypothetical protein
MRIALSITLALAAGCSSGCGNGHGSDAPPGVQLVYTDPPAGSLRLIHDPATTSPQAIVLAFVVGAQPLSGYATGFNLPLDASKIALASFTPGTGLAAGQPPHAASAVIPSHGPLAGMLVTALSQKASGAGAVTTDTPLAPDTILFTLRLAVADGATAGVVFDGTAAGFTLPSGGLRNRAGTAIVAPGQVSIGKLELR